MLPSVIGYSSLDPYQTVVGIGNVPVVSNTIRITDLVYLLTNDHPLNKIESGKVDETLSVHIVADYLKEIHAHVLNRLQLKFNNLEKIRYSFTLYSDKHLYRDKLLQAILLAGICSEEEHVNKIVFVDAYLAMGRHIYDTTKELGISDSFVICDADDTYTSVKAMEIFSEKRALHVKELSSHQAFSRTLTGDDIDKRFEEFISPALQKHPDYQRAQKDELETLKKAAVDSFVKDIKVKRKGGGNLSYCNADKSTSTLLILIVKRMLI